MYILAENSFDWENERFKLFTKAEWAEQQKENENNYHYRECCDLYDLEGLHTLLGYLVAFISKQKD